MKKLLERIPWRLRDLVDKVSSTFIQAFLTALVGGSFFLAPNVDSVTKAGLAGITATITLLLALVNAATIDSRLSLAHQAVLRIARTAAAAALGWLAAVPLLDLDQLVDGSLWKGVWFALSTAVLAAVKAEIAKHVGDKATVGIASMSQSDVIAQLMPSPNQLRHVDITTVDFLFADGTRSTMSTNPPPTFSRS